MGERVVKVFGKHGCTCVLTRFAPDASMCRDSIFGLPHSQVSPNSTCSSLLNSVKVVPLFSQPISRGKATIDRFLGVVSCSASSGTTFPDILLFPCDLL